MKSAKEKLLIIGHRGASGYEPENTLRAFKKAIDMGVDIIELDVYQCKSGELVVMHDATIDRTTTGKGKVKELTWDELQKYDAGMGEHIPLLSEVFDLVDKRIVINIELKDTDAVRPLAQLIKNYSAKKNWSPTQFMVSSFDHQAVSAFHVYCPEVPAGIIFEKNPQTPLETVQRIHAQYAIMHYSSIAPEFVNAAHQNDIHVFAYTVNSCAEALTLQKEHIDGIITNYPDILASS